VSEGISTLMGRIKVRLQAVRFVKDAQVKHGLVNLIEQDMTSLMDAIDRKVCVHTPYND